MNKVKIITRGKILYIDYVKNSKRAIKSLKLKADKFRLNKT